MQELFNLMQDEHGLTLTETEMQEIIVISKKTIDVKTESGAQLPCSGGLSDADSYAYKNIEEYEGIVDCKVNEAFRIGWSMARATMKQLRALGGEEEGR